MRPTSSSAAPTRRRVVLALVLTAIAAAAHVGARLNAQSPAEPSDDGAAGDTRAAFTAALIDAQRSGAPLDLPTPPHLAAYPLAPYLEAARITRALQLAEAVPPTRADAAAAGFIERHRGEPVVRQVEAARLESLARRGAWPQVLEQTRHVTTRDSGSDSNSDSRSDSGDDSGSDSGDDSARGSAHDAGRHSVSDAVRCMHLNARIQTGAVDDIAPRIVEVWLSGYRLPIECEALFEWFRAEGRMSDALIEERVRRLLENGHAAFARTVAGRLPEARRAFWNRWADLIERPRESLDRLLAAPQTPLPDRAIEDGWSRLARNTPLDALERYPAVTHRFADEPATRSRLALALALGLAWDRRAEALDLFRQVDAAHLDDYALGWLARAALWNGRLQLADNAIAAMSPEHQQLTRWRYWAARVAEQHGRRREARDGYRAVLATDNFYAAMAAARLDTAVRPHQDSVRHDRRTRARLETLPALVRARELRAVRMPGFAAAEWRHGLASVTPDDRLQAIHVAADWGWYDMAVATASSGGIYFDYRLLYPTPYAHAVEAAAQESRIEPALLHALIRQESLYRADAASAAGALGLTQLLPDTAARAARRLGAPAPRRADLLVPETNVRLGAAELRALFDAFDEQLPVALAGYNAGPNAARRWLPDEPLDPDVWIENIPYNETRDYVQRVLWHSVVFAWLENGEPRDTRAWLTPIRGSDAVPADRE